MRRSILILESDERMARFMVDNLCADGYEAAVLSAGEALGFGDLVIVSAEHPISIEEVREAYGSDVPILALVRAGGSRAANDYLVKPFSYAELLGRIRGLARQRGRGHIHVEELAIDTGARTVRMAGQLVDLTNKEFALLKHLALDPERVCTKNELLRDIWGYLSIGHTRTVDAHACRLRRKLGGRPWVENVRGVGYRLRREDT